MKGTGTRDNNNGGCNSNEGTKQRGREGKDKAKRLRLKKHPFCRLQANACEKTRKEVATSHGVPSCIDVAGLHKGIQTNAYVQGKMCVYMFKHTYTYIHTFKKLPHRYTCMQT